MSVRVYVCVCTFVTKGNGRTSKQDQVQGLGL